MHGIGARHHEHLAGWPSVRGAASPLPLTSWSETISSPKLIDGLIMTTPAENFLHLAAGATALSALPRIARAQTYPARPVRLIVGFAAGGSTPITGRLMGQWLSVRLRQQVIIENRTGAGSNIAAEAVLTVIMHEVARFCTSGERARAGNPTGWIGVRRLAVQRVWG
jgi:hypothetical protein